MTLGEILIAIARELLGIPPAKNPRRRPPDALPSPAWDGGPSIAPLDWTAEETPAPRRAASPADLVAPAVRRVSRDDVEEAYARAIRTPADAPPADGPTGKGRGSKAALPEGFVERLRNNPNAAREAFVYAEIFGPPKADGER